MTEQHVRVLAQTEPNARPLRLVVTLLMGVGMLLRQEVVPLAPGLVILAGYTIWCFLIGRLLGSGQRPWAGYLVIAVDCIASVGTMLVLGLEGPAVILFPLVIVYYAVTAHFLGGLLAAALLAIGYLGVAASEREIVRNWEIVVAQIPTFFILAYFTTWLATRRGLPLTPERSSPPSGE